ncbi:MAG: hypothetical protein CMC98_02965 [Flavobacteriales bacterium]|nr:hypothetical protein [Flavobacteriales bacterium]|tara:strand:+ start:3306 stop:3746 length:441 start_codon:yes stop_codon:yes gene_type:complete
MSNKITQIEKKEDYPSGLEPFLPETVFWRTILRVSMMDEIYDKQYFNPKVFNKGLYDIVALSNEVVKTSEISYDYIIKHISLVRKAIYKKTNKPKKTRNEVRKEINKALNLENINNINVSTKKNSRIKSRNLKKRIKRQHHQSINL